MTAIILQYREAFIAGLTVTLTLCGVAILVGIVAGVGLGAAAAQWRASVGNLVQALSFLVSSIPILVVLFWCHYPLQRLLDVVVDPFWTALAVLSLLSVSGTADIVRRVLVDFPRQYLDAARVCGLSDGTTFFRIQLPLILRALVPSLIVHYVVVLQATLFASLISVEELFRVAQRINSQLYRPIEIYSALALFFVAICLPLNLLAAFLRERFSRDTSEA